MRENTSSIRPRSSSTETTRAILATSSGRQPPRVVFDSLSELRLLAQSALRYRREVLNLKQYFTGRKSTVLLLDDRTSEPGDMQLQSLAHGVIALEQMPPEYGGDRRRLRVSKLRGAPFRGGYHDFAIAHGGLEVFPRLVAAEHHDDVRARRRCRAASPELDALLGGGLDARHQHAHHGAGRRRQVGARRRSYVCAAARRGERVGDLRVRRAARGTLIAAPTASAWT